MQELAFTSPDIDVFQTLLLEAVEHAQEEGLTPHVYMGLRRIFYETQLSGRGGLYASELEGFELKVLNDLVRHAAYESNDSWPELTDLRARFIGARPELDNQFFTELYQLMGIDLSEDTR